MYIEAVLMLVISFVSTPVMIVFRIGFAPSLAAKALFATNHVNASIETIGVKFVPTPRAHSAKFTCKTPAVVSPEAVNPEPLVSDPTESFEVSKSAFTKSLLKVRSIQSTEPLLFLSFVTALLRVLSVVNVKFTFC